MAIKFNDFNNQYNKYGFVIGKNSPKEAKKAEETKESKDVAQTNAEFKGLENETDLLTKNLQSVYGVKIAKYTTADKELADNTNEILASLGYNYKVSAAQVASVANNVNTTVLPAMQLAEEGAVAAHIQDPNGPFADLFA
jgi:hypothetical protein